MFLDYFLTIKGFRLYKQKYSKFIEAESYELNPNFKKSVNARKYNFLHLIGVIFVSAFIYAIYYLGTNNIFYFTKSSFFTCQGMLFSIFGFINMRHIQNIMIFKFVNKNPSMLSGKLKQKNSFTIYASRISTFTFSIFLFFVFLLVPTSFTFGLALGLFLFSFKQRRYDKKK